MTKLCLSWSCPPKGGTKHSDCWDDIADLLNNLRLFSGCVTVDKLDDEGYLISEIQVRMETGLYIVTYLNEEDEIMTISDSTQPDERVLILGDYWPARQITRDFDFVVKVFKEFFHNGKVSTELLS